MQFKQFINGEWVDASNGGTWDVINPATEEVIEIVSFGNRDDARAAVEAAENAFPEWSGKTAYERAAILKKAADLIWGQLDELAAITTRESGKPFREAKGEWYQAGEIFEWFAEEGKRAYGRIIPSRNPHNRLMTIKQPIGVVGVITAWNFPIYNQSRAVAAALAAGCSVVTRPSEYTPMTAMVMVNLLEEAGIPAGVINLINGEPESMGQELLDNKAVRKVHFTGSTRVGHILMEGASRTFTRLSLELGGNAPVLILPDANIEVAAKTAVSAKFYNAGQMCTSPQRFIVHSGVANEFVDLVSQRMSALVVGNGMEKDTRVGPLINQTQLERLESLVADTQAEVVLGGERPVGHDKGYFYSPTLLTNVDPASRIYNEEIFGPVLPVTTFDDLDEAIDRANQTDYGLMAYVWTNDLNVAIRAYEKLEFGMVGVNEWFPQAVEAPFPGWKSSGTGMELGSEGLDEYLETKLIAIGGLR
ncbi:MAG: NAD-dependent succinate-semialdehyde dehydrogenase [Chloroflexi bacterium]|nr:NAD-dependent succinate-semialdehyde dehydrogenase [Chloroflexota bacterium]